MNTRASQRFFLRVTSSFALILLLASPLSVAAVAANARDAGAALVVKPSAQTQKAAAPQQTRTPSEVVREFYKAMREKRFRDAFAMTIYQPAIEGLSAEEFAELRPDFEEMAAEFPESVEINGEQLSADTATVFVKVVEGGADKLKPTELIREGGNWIIGGRGDQTVVRQRGKQFFFEARIAAHESSVEDTFKRIAAAELLHSAQNGGTFADLPALVREGHVPVGVLTPEESGYRFHLALTGGGKGYSVGAEPLRYGRTGRLSFYMDAASGLKSKDTGGKPLKK
jgi:hypothetical protein